MTTTMIRASVESKEILRSLAGKYNLSQQKMFDKIMLEVRKKEFFNNMNQSFIKLKRDSKAWKEEQEERSITDNALLDFSL